MVGQDRLLSQFNNFSITTLPHTMMFVGEYGCGKKTLCQYIADKFNLEIHYVVDTINLELVNSILETINPSMYVLNGDEITTKEEAVLLKIIEEPPANIYFVINCTSTLNMLSTIINRCSIFRFEKYTDDILTQFGNPVQKTTFNFYSFANTPGKVKAWAGLDLSTMMTFIEKVYAKISLANIANVLTIVNKISFSNDEKDKFPIDAFLFGMLYCVKQNVVDNKPNAYENYKLTSKLLSDMKIPNLNKKQLFEHYLYRLKEIS